MKIICRLILMVIFANPIVSFAISVPNVEITPSIFTSALKPMPNIVVPFIDTSVTYEDAMKEFKNLSRAEKKHRIKDAKSLLKEYKKQKKAGDDVSSNQVLMAILCVILPPLAVYLHEKETNTKFWISLLLTLLLWLPGIIYALLVVFNEL